MSSINNVAHVSSVDKGLKMKIKRTKVPSKADPKQEMKSEIRRPALFPKEVVTAFSTASITPASTPAFSLISNKMLGNVVPHLPAESVTTSSSTSTSLPSSALPAPPGVTVSSNISMAITNPTVSLLKSVTSEALPETPNCGSSVAIPGKPYIKSNLPTSQASDSKDGKSLRTKAALNKKVKDCKLKCENSTPTVVAFIPSGPQSQSCTGEKTSVPLTINNQTLSTGCNPAPPHMSGIRDPTMTCEPRPGDAVYMKQENLIHDPYEFNAKVEDKIELPPKKLKLEKTEYMETATPSQPQHPHSPCMSCLPPQHPHPPSPCMSCLPPPHSPSSPAQQQRHCHSRSIGVDVCSVGITTEPDSLGPCEPGTVVGLEGIVWKETENGLLVVNVTWRGKTYVGTLMDATRYAWAPPRPSGCESPVSDFESRTTKSRSKRTSRNSAQATTEQQLPEGRRLRKNRRGTVNSSSSIFTAPPSPAKTDISSGSNTKRKTKQNEMDNDKPKRSRPCSQGVVGVESPTPDGYIVCPEPNCHKKYKHMNGLRYHKTHAHRKTSAAGEGRDEDDEDDDNEDKLEKMEMTTLCERTRMKERQRMKDQHRSCERGSKDALDDDIPLKEIAGKANGQSSCHVKSGSRGQVNNESRGQVNNESRDQVSNESRGQVNSKSGDQVNNESGDQVNNESGDQVSNEGICKVNNESSVRVNNESSVQVNKSAENAEMLQDVNKDTVNTESGVEMMESSDLKVLTKALVHKGQEPEEDRPPPSVKDSSSSQKDILLSSTSSVSTIASSSCEHSPPATSDSTSHKVDQPAVASVKSQRYQVTTTVTGPTPQTDNIQNVGVSQIKSLAYVPQTNIVQNMVVQPSAQIGTIQSVAMSHHQLPPAQMTQQTDTVQSVAISHPQLQLPSPSTVNQTTNSGHSVSSDTQTSIKPQSSIKPISCARPIIPAPSPSISSQPSSQAQSLILKPIQPKPTIMGDHSQPSPVLAELNKDRSRKVKKKKKDNPGISPNDAAQTEIKGQTQSVASKGAQAASHSEDYKSEKSSLTRSSNPSITQELSNPNNSLTFTSSQNSPKLQSSTSSDIYTTYRARVAVPPSTLPVSCFTDKQNTLNDDVHSPAYSDISDANDSGSPLDLDSPQNESSLKKDCQVPGPPHLSSHDGSSILQQYGSNLFYLNPEFLAPGNSQQMPSTSKENTNVEGVRQSSVNDNFQIKKEGMRSMQETELPHRSSFLNYYRHPHIAQSASPLQFNLAGHNPSSIDPAYFMMVQQSIVNEQRRLLQAEATNKTEKQQAPSKTNLVAGSEFESSGKIKQEVFFLDGQQVQKQSLGERERLQLLRENIDLSAQLGFQQQPIRLQDQQNLQLLKHQNDLLREQINMQQRQRLFEIQRQRKDLPELNSTAHMSPSILHKHMADTKGQGLIHPDAIKKEPVPNKDTAADLKLEAQEETARCRSSQLSQDLASGSRTPALGSRTPGPGSRTPSQPSTPNIPPPSSTPSSSLPSTLSSSLPVSLVTSVPSPAAFPFPSYYSPFRPVHLDPVYRTFNAHILSFPGTSPGGFPPGYISTPQLGYKIPPVDHARKSPDADTQRADSLAQGYAVHKINEFQNKSSPILGEMSPAKSVNGDSPSGSTTPGLLPEKVVDKKREYSGSPPTHRHVHTHHHTHVIGGFPALCPTDPYSAMFGHTSPVAAAIQPGPTPFPPHPPPTPKS